MADLHQAFNTVVRRCLAVKPGEDVLIIVDPATRAIGEALREEAAEASADAVLAVMDERATDGTEPPPTLAAALAACDVFIAPTSRSLSHTTARKKASEARALFGRSRLGGPRPTKSRSDAGGSRGCCCSGWPHSAITCPRRTDLRHCVGRWGRNRRG